MYVVARHANYRRLNDIRINVYKHKFLEYFEPLRKLILSQRRCHLFVSHVDEELTDYLSRDSEGFCLDEFARNGIFARLAESTSSRVYPNIAVEKRLIFHKSPHDSISSPGPYRPWIAPSIPVIVVVRLRFSRRGPL